MDENHRKKERSEVTPGTSEKFDTYMKRILHTRITNAFDRCMRDRAKFILLPNRQLSVIEKEIAGRMLDGNLILKTYLDQLRDRYDFILIDSIAMINPLSVNAFIAADSILIPTITEKLSSEGLETMVETINTVRRFHGNHRDRRNLFAGKECGHRIHTQKAADDGIQTGIRDQ